MVINDTLHTQFWVPHIHTDQKSDSNTKPNINMSTFLKTQIQLTYKIKILKTPCTKYQGNRGTRDLIN